MDFSNGSRKRLRFLSPGSYEKIPKTTRRVSILLNIYIISKINSNYSFQRHHIKINAESSDIYFDNEPEQIAKREFVPKSDGWQTAQNENNSEIEMQPEFICNQRHISSSDSSYTQPELMLDQRDVDALNSDSSASISSASNNLDDSDATTNSSESDMQVDFVNGQDLNTPGVNIATTNNELHESNNANPDLRTHHPHQLEKNDVFHYKQKVNPNLSVTVSEVMIMTLLLYLRHNLTLTALEDIMSYAKIITESTNLPESKFLFRSMFPSKLKPKTHFYCPTCLLSIDVILDGTDETQQELLCLTPNCNTMISLSTAKEGNFFFTYPTTPQVEEIIKNNINKFTYKRDSTNINICDVCDGKLYKDLLANSEEDIVTLTTNTDGVKVNN
jgi:hypothetical protein